ncbi:serine/threonine-protein phosphatase 4 regulatory subunit 2 [Pelomyxa schiedti]|nr:serine/threonine-protein phosphatase 4 regulatory subunit 2 [Pelomyxa schiedti]
MQQHTGVGSGSAASTTNTPSSSTNTNALATTSILLGAPSSGAPISSTSTPGNSNNSSTTNATPSAAATSSIGLAQAPPSLRLVRYTAELKVALEDFVLGMQGQPTKPIPPELVQVVANIALTGYSCYPWSHLKFVFHRLLNDNMIQIHGKSGWPEASQESFDTKKEEILRALVTFTEAPWTLQRLAEVSVCPQQYTRAKSYLFALEKLLTVSSTQPHLTPQQVVDVNNQIRGYTPSPATSPTPIPTQVQSPNTSPFNPITTHPAPSSTSSTFPPHPVPNSNTTTASSTPPTTHLGTAATDELQPMDDM